MMKMNNQLVAMAARATRMPDERHMIPALHLRPVGKRAQEPCMKHMDKGETVAQRKGIDDMIKEARAEHAARMQNIGT